MVGVWVGFVFVSKYYAAHPELYAWRQYDVWRFGGVYRVTGAAKRDIQIRFCGIDNSNNPYLILQNVVSEHRYRILHHRQR